MYSMLGATETAKIRLYLSYSQGASGGWEQGESQEKKKQDNLNSNNEKYTK